MRDLYLFVGGPWDGKHVATDGSPTFMVPVPPPLEEMLSASLSAMERPTAIPGFRVAVYRLGRRNTEGWPENLLPFDANAYLYEGER